MHCKRGYSRRLRPSREWRKSWRQSQGWRFHIQPLSAPAAVQCPIVHCLLSFVLSSLFLALHRERTKCETRVGQLVSKVTMSNNFNQESCIQYMYFTVQNTLILKTCDFHIHQ